MRTKGPWSRNIKPARKYVVIFASQNTHALLGMFKHLRSVYGGLMLPETRKALDKLIAKAEGE
jgi:hypothetical protein